MPSMEATVQRNRILVTDFRREPPIGTLTREMRIRNMAKLRGLCSRFALCPLVAIDTAKSADPPEDNVMLDGETAHLEFTGVPEQTRVAVPLKPGMLASERLKTAVPPAETVADVEAPAAGWTASGGMPVPLKPTT